MARGDEARHGRGGGPFEPLSPRSQPPERDEDRMERDECVADEERARQCPSTELTGLSPKDALPDAAPTTSGDAGADIGAAIGDRCSNSEERPHPPSALAPEPTHPYNRDQPAGKQTDP